jgi:hypothetical protein
MPFITDCCTMQRATRGVDSADMHIVVNGAALQCTHLLLAPVALAVAVLL